MSAKIRKKQEDRLMRHLSRAEQKQQLQYRKEIKKMVAAAPKYLA